LSKKVEVAQSTSDSTPLKAAKPPIRTGTPPVRFLNAKKGKIPYSQARVRRDAPHGMPESGVPGKIPAAFGRNGQKTRGPWPKGGIFLGEEAPQPPEATGLETIQLN